MTKKTARIDKLICSFCGKSRSDVKKLVAGQGVYICDECISLCNDILQDEDDDENGIVIDDDDELGDNNKLLVDCSWTPEEHWLTPNGGMTADASIYLHELDSKGELI